MRTTVDQDEIHHAVADEVSAGRLTAKQGATLTMIWWSFRRLTAGGRRGR